MAELDAQKQTLNVLGRVDLDTTGLTLAVTEEQLHQPALRKAGGHNWNRDWLGLCK